MVSKLVEGENNACINYREDSWYDQEEKLKMKHRALYEKNEEASEPYSTDKFPPQSIFIDEAAEEDEDESYTCDREFGEEAYSVEDMESATLYFDEEDANAVRPPLNRTTSIGCNYHWVSICDMDRPEAPATFPWKFHSSNELFYTKNLSEYYISDKFGYIKRLAMRKMKYYDGIIIHDFYLNEDKVEKYTTGDAGGARTKLINDIIAALQNKWKGMEFFSSNSCCEEVELECMWKNLTRLDRQAMQFATLGAIVYRFSCSGTIDINSNIFDSNCTAVNIKELCNEMIGYERLMHSWPSKNMLTGVSDLNYIGDMPNTNPNEYDIEIKACKEVITAIKTLEMEFKKYRKTTLRQVEDDDHLDCDGGEITRLSKESWKWESMPNMLNTMVAKIGTHTYFDVPKVRGVIG